MTIDANRDMTAAERWHEIELLNCGNQMWDEHSAAIKAWGEAYVAEALVGEGNEKGTLYGIPLEVIRELLHAAQSANMTAAEYLAAVKRLRAALEAVEWVNFNGLEMCPICKAWRYHEGHKPGCGLTAALTAKPPDTAHTPLVSEADVTKRDIPGDKTWREAAEGHDFYELYHAE